MRPDWAFCWGPWRCGDRLLDPNSVPGHPDMVCQQMKPDSRIDHRRAASKPRHDGRKTHGNSHRRAMQSNQNSRLVRLSREFIEYLAYYFRSKRDGAWASAKTSAVFVWVWALATFAVAVLVFTGMVLVFRGLVGGGTELLGGQLWLSELVVGSLALAGAAMAIKCGVTRLLERQAERTIKQYEERQAKQRSKFGHSVEEQAGIEAHPK